MCDDLTETDNANWLASQKLDRRDFAVIGASAAALAMAPGSHARTGATAQGLATVSRAVSIKTPDGIADGVFITPIKGKHPAVIMWPDIAGLRDAYKTMGTRLAAAGYAVLVVNQYYRNAHAPVLASFAEWTTPAGQAKLGPMIAAIKPAGTTSDGAAFVRWLDGQKEVDTRRKIGSCGYCMGGPFTVRTALGAPDRVGAACSFHGAALVSDAADSPVKLLGRTKAAFLFAIAKNDDARQPDAKTALRAAAAAAHRPAEIEVYPANHGWCTIDAPVYDHAAAEKAWARMLATYKQYL
jgi:carboxymethylenebutenolidase